ncbi:MAG: hypothetical protein ABIJ45_15045 [Candidatus Zixiibacteriota bacterium]
MRLLLILVLTITLFITVNLNAQDQSDIIGAILDSVGLDRNDIGYQMHGYWSRFPLDITYRLTSFDALFAEPLKLYDYSKTMANAVKTYMIPSYLDSNSDALYKLTYALGVDRKLGGFRPYSANLLEIRDSSNIISTAVASLYPNKIEVSDILDTIKQINKKLPSKSQFAIARLILNLPDIAHWIELAFRNVEPEKLKKLRNDRFNDDPDLFDNYHPEYDDLASTIDYSSLHYAALKATAIIELTADTLSAYGGLTGDKIFTIESQYGKIQFIGSEYKSDRLVDISENLLTIDFGGDRLFGYQSDISKTVLPLSILINMAGNDIYESNLGVSFGSALGGVNLLYDYSGNDKYRGRHFSQGVGMFGVGILYDRGGDDSYSAGLMAQGAGYFGIGLCFDVAGNDSFFVYGMGQGFGGHGGGVGVLADYGGDDKYIGEPNPEVFDLADYHSKGKINGNFVQGVGSGRRADMTDGHSWAGGLGAIIDINGNDSYYSGNWSLGTGYWFATGIAYDGTGDDIYKSCYFTQGSGAHFCNGILIDEDGNDKHELYETAGAGLGFGWDFTNAFLINIGGNDSYQADMISIGLAEVRSNAFLIDIGGDDTYRLKEGALGLGAVDYRDYYITPSKLSTYFYDAKSFGGFIDIGGNDKYISFTDSTTIGHNIADNNKFWQIPAKSDSAYGYHNFGIGVDTEDGIIPEIEQWKELK